MRHRLIDEILQLLRRMLQPTRPPAERRRQRHRGRPEPSPASDRPPASDIDDDTLQIEYSPSRDGDPDPGEVIWTWVPYEEDPSQGKDRPVVIIGRRAERLLGVPLTSKRHDGEEQVLVGNGPWDREGRPSFAKVERLLEVDPQQVRREGAVLPRDRFDAVVAGVRRAQRG